MKIGVEVILLEDMRIHLVGDSRAIIIIRKGTKGVVIDSWENSTGEQISILWDLFGFGFIARYNPKWKLREIRNEA